MMFWGSKSGISSKYSFSNAPTFTSEPWSVFTGRLKSSSSSNNSNNKVSIFVFDKKQFEHYLSNYGIIKSRSSSRDKQLLSEGYDILRDQVNNLAKLKHPNILTLIEPLEEHSKNFMFVTEYVTGTLETVFNNANSDEEEDFLQGHIKNDITIQRGIQQIVTGLDFIHNRASAVHLALEPRSIFINENSDWKISGLGHLSRLPSGTNTADYIFKQYDPRIPQFMTLNLNFTAPELVYENTLSCKNDYFALGVLINFLYSGNDKLIDSENSLSQYKSEYVKFEKKISSMSWENIFNKLPTKLQHCIPKLMNRDIYSRYENITDFLDTDFFQDPLVKTLNFLDDLPTKSNEEKVVFLDGLSELLPQYPAPLLQKKFLPILLDLLTQLCNEKQVNVHCISKDLEIIIKIGQNLSQLTFHERLLPIITNANIFPILLLNATIVIIENLSALKEKVKSNILTDNIIIPLLKFVLQENVQENAVLLQNKLLEQIALILECFDFPTVKNFLLPTISQLFSKTTSLAVKLSCISSFGTLIEKQAVDSYTCSSEILSLFKAMKTRDARIMLRSLSLFEQVPKLISDDVVLVDTLLPLLWSFSMAPTLTKSQYGQFIKTINGLSRSIQEKHIKGLSTGNEEPKDNATIFKNMIDTSMPKSNVPKASELENQASKSVNVPVIQPAKKGSMKPSILTPRNNTTSSTLSSTLSSKDKGFTSPITPKATSSVTLSGYASVQNGTLNQPTQSKNLHSLGLNKNDHMTNIVSNTTNNTTITTFTNTTNNGFKDIPVKQPNTLMPSVNVSAPPTTNLPPGFSLALQPNKKESSNTPPPMQNFTEGSLI